MTYYQQNHFSDKKVDINLKECKKPSAKRASLHSHLNTMNNFSGLTWSSLTWALSVSKIFCTTWRKKVSWNSNTKKYNPKDLVTKYPCTTKPKQHFSADTPACLYVLPLFHSSFEEAVSLHISSHMPNFLSVRECQLYTELKWYLCPLQVKKYQPNL